jgi:hypothetical protein
MSDSANYGISGVGNIAAQNVVVGENSSITSTNANSSVEQSNGAEQLSQSLAALRAAIEALQAPPATREALLATHAEVTRELQAPAPDKGKLLGKLTSMSQLAGPAAAIVQAVAALSQVIMTIL